MKSRPGLRSKFFASNRIFAGVLVASTDFILIFQLQRTFEQYGRGKLGENTVRVRLISCEKRIDFVGHKHCFADDSVFVIVSFETAKTF